MASQRVILAGGSGFVGQALARSLLADAYEVIVLSRHNAPNVRGEVLCWDGANLGDWSTSLEDSLAVVNLAGRNINCRLTPANRKEIVHSRVASVRVLAGAIQQCRRKPRVFVQTTAVGIYGDTGDAICDESTPPGNGFLAETCRQWEDTYRASPLPDVRRVMLRLGVVLGRKGGAFPPLATLARCFLGGAVGRGRQYLSWLHAADAVRIYRAAIGREDFEGEYVATSPQSVTNAQFMRELRAVLHRPWSPSVPALAVRVGGWLAGINPELALRGQRCIPRRLLQSGFAFEFPELRPALDDLVGPPGSSP